MARIRRTRLDFPGALAAHVVTPTDPVVASSIDTGRLAERSLPDRLRSTLSLESGANDGLAYLIVLPILLIGSASPSAALERWLVDTLLVGVLLAIGVGVVIGCLVFIALHRADKIGWVEEHSLLGLSVALSLAVVTVAKLLGSDGILAAFAAAAAFNFGVDRGEEFEDQNVQEAIRKLFNQPIFVIFGAMLPWREWFGLGWFGPIGVAAIYYALLAEERTHDPVHWHVASLVVVVSILAHASCRGPA